MDNIISYVDFVLYSTFVCRNMNVNEAYALFKTDDDRKTFKHILSESLAEHGMTFKDIGFKEQ